MNESQVLADVQKALGKLPDLALWRNNIGSPDRIHHYGLPVGSADLIGILSPTGRLIALECKSATGKLRPEQIRWLTAVRAMGGFACVVRSADEALSAITRARLGKSE